MSTFATSKDLTFDLRNLGNVDISDQKDLNERQSHDTGSSSKHSRLRIAVRFLDCRSCGASDQITQLRVQVLENACQV